MEKGYKPNIKDLNKITACYPMIYKYLNKEKVNLLQMQVNSTNYDKTFGIIFNKDKIKMFLDILKNKIDILNNFIKKIYDIGAINEKKYNIKDTVNPFQVTIDNFDETFDDVFLAYISSCENSCFMGWSNTPGYYILSQIDYNEYLKLLIPTIVKDISLDGIYVEKDQNEIILFNTKKLNKDKITINYVLPYKFYNKLDEENYENYENAKKFINNYNEKCKNYLNDNTNETNKKDIIDIFKEFNYIDNELLWNFDWFTTFCEVYDPYEDIDITESKCKELFKKKENENTNCTKRYPLNPAALNIEEDYGYFECTIPRSTSKLSILNIREHSQLLKNWMNKIEYFNEGKLKIFNSICLDRKIGLNRIL